MVEWWNGGLVGLVDWVVRWARVGRLGYRVDGTLCTEQGVVDWWQLMNVGCGGWWDVEWNVECGRQEEGMNILGKGNWEWEEGKFRGEG